MEDIEKKIEDFADIVEQLSQRISHLPAIMDSLTREMDRHHANLAKAITLLREFIDKKEMEWKNAEYIVQCQIDEEKLKPNKNDTMKALALNLSTQLSLQPHLIESELQTELQNYVNTCTDHCENAFHWWDFAPNVPNEKSEVVDWTIEDIQRRVNKRRLNFSASNDSPRDINYEKLIQIVRDQLGGIPIQVVKHDRDHRGKPIITVEFRSEREREKILPITKKMHADGVLAVTESMTNIELKEKATMLSMGQALENQGRHVQFRDQKLFVDDVPWQYIFAEGWKQV